MGLNAKQQNSALRSGRLTPSLQVDPKPMSDVTDGWINRFDGWLAG